MALTYIIIRCIIIAFSSDSAGRRRPNLPLPPEAIIVACGGSKYMYLQGRSEPMKPTAVAAVQGRILVILSGINAAIWIYVVSLMR